MLLPTPLVKGTILKRYKRFLADIKLENDEVITAHVANTGSMTTCWEPGQDVIMTYVDSPKRKLKYSLQLIHNGDTWIGVNTSLTNKVVHEALSENLIKELIGYENIQPEKKVGKSRIDFFLSGHKSKPDCYVEVKNVTLLGENKTALFPDAVSTRGQKHLEELTSLKESGLRTCMLYIVQREDANKFKPAKDIDPVYANLLQAAINHGVEVLIYQCEMNSQFVKIKNQLTLEL